MVRIIYLRVLVPERSAIPMDSLEMGISTSCGFHGISFFLCFGVFWVKTPATNVTPEENQTSSQGIVQPLNSADWWTKFQESPWLCFILEIVTVPPKTPPHTVWGSLAVPRAVPCVSHTMTMLWAITRTLLAVPIYKNNSLAQPLSEEPTKASTQHGKIKKKIGKICEFRERWGV